MTPSSRSVAMAGEIPGCVGGGASCGRRDRQRPGAVAGRPRSRNAGVVGNGVKCTSALMRRERACDLDTESARLLSNCCAGLRIGGWKSSPRRLSARRACDSFAFVRSAQPMPCNSRRHSLAPIGVRRLWNSSHSTSVSPTRRGRKDLQSWTSRCREPQPRGAKGAGGLFVPAAS